MCFLTIGMFDEYLQSAQKNKLQTFISHLVYIELPDTQKTLLLVVYCL